MAKAVVILQEALATRRSQASAIDRPAPAAAPSSCATTGFGIWCRMRETSMPWRRFAILASNGSGARPSAIDLTSPPTQKVPPAPLISTARTSWFVGRAPRRLDQAARHVRIERIAPLRPVHGDGEQALVELLEDHFVWLMAFAFVVIGFQFVIARSEATKQSRSGALDCFASLAMTVDAQFDFFTSGQRDSSSGWNASLPATVPTSL